MNQRNLKTYSHSQIAILQMKNRRSSEKCVPVFDTVLVSDVRNISFAALILY